MVKTVDVDELHDQPSELEDDREGFSARKKTLRPGTRGFLLIMGLTLLLTIAWSIRSFLPKSTHSGKSPGQAVVENYFPEHHFSIKPIKQVTSTQTSETGHPTPSHVNAALNPRTVPDLPEDFPSPEEKVKTPEELAMERRLSNDLSSNDAGSKAPIGEEAQPLEDRKIFDGSSRLANRLNGARMQPARAKIMPHQNLTIAQGTMIPCGTLEEINTTQPGFIECQISEDIWSVNGKVRLLDKGSRVDGEIATGVTEGQNRVFVTWTRIRTSEGVIVDLDSPGVGALGAPGFSGSVDTHFWTRFGNAMLVSVLSDAGQAFIQSLSNLSSKSGTTNLNLANSNSSSNQLANQVLQQTLNVAPTLYKQQGSAVMIFVARDIDFSDVYSLNGGT